MTGVVVLVEGHSDALVVEHLLGPVPGVRVVPMGGVTNVGHHLAQHARGDSVVLGLCDSAEEHVVRRALGLAAGDLSAHGFHVCDRDLEDELIRALGPAAVEEVLSDLGELRSFRRFQRQPEWRGRPVTDQLHRFAGSGSGRKARLARALAARLDPATVPEPLRRLLAAAADADPRRADPPQVCGDPRG